MTALKLMEGKVEADNANEQANIFISSKNEREGNVS